MRPADAAERLRRDEWDVVDSPLSHAKALVARLHYSGGGSNTGTDIHGLVRRDEPMRVRGVAWWLPPTRVAAETVHPEWKRVVALTRLVIEPDVPANAASFLLSRSVKILRREGRWRAVVTYADESQNHTGAIYRASGWEYVGRVGPHPRWLDSTGKQVSPKATVNRTKAEMEALGHELVGHYYKHKFVIVFKHSRPEPRQGSIDFDCFVP